MAAAGGGGSGAGVGFGGVGCPAAGDGGAEVPRAGGEAAGEVCPAPPQGGDAGALPQLPEAAVAPPGLVEEVALGGEGGEEEDVAARGVEGVQQEGGPGGGVCGDADGAAASEGCGIPRAALRRWGALGGGGGGELRLRRGDADFLRGGCGGAYGDGWAWGGGGSTGGFFFPPYGRE